MADERGRPSGLGRPLVDVLRQGASQRGNGINEMLGEGQPDDLGPVLELLRLTFPDHVIGVCSRAIEPLTLHIGGPVQDDAVAWAVSSALHAVLRRGVPQIAGPPEAPVYALPMGREGAVAVHRSGGVLEPDERRLLELLARHLRAG